MLSRPAILIVDDDPAALTAMLDALARRFAGDYRVVSQLAPDTALDESRRLAESGERRAGSSHDRRSVAARHDRARVSQQAHELHPTAQRALLVDWGDRRASPAIIQGCAVGQLENYLHKPWSPPEVHSTRA